MAILTRSGRIGIARSVKARQIFLAWGTGNLEWGNNPPTEDLLSATGLVNEVGRRICESVEFCTPDDQGEIISTSGRFSVSESPTNNLHFTVLFDFEDAAGQEIREYGLFLNTVVQSDLPIGQRYFLPTEIEDPGELLMLENCVPLIRTGNTKHACSFVVTF
ncbi:MAG: hypothetical protein IJ730_07350 [Alphaproteobacteria bacterium]|nr:hypothetical protein [Alphaproteobacteria bacterium]